MSLALFPDHRPPSLDQAVQILATNDEDGRGAVYTKAEVVDLILDLAGYTPDQPLHQRRLLEPSCGAGDFLLAALDRLLEAFTRGGGGPGTALALAPAIRGVEIHEPAYLRTRSEVVERLSAWGTPEVVGQALADVWLVRDDFLLTPFEGGFDVVVGNPPYVRLERIPPVLQEEYRRRFKTIYDRADLYVPFFERGLALLRPGGLLAFICSNRWLKNKYGGPLRAFAASRYHLRYFIDMVGTPAFHSEVIAYPAITVFQHGTGEATRIARRPEVSADSLASLSHALRQAGPVRDPRVDEVVHAVDGAEPWLLDTPDQLRLLRRLEGTLPTLEGAGCKVGIGVATGADKVFIGKLGELPVEAERKLPLAMAGDLQGLDIRWGGLGVVNPFNDDGSLADFAAFPRFGAYMQAHAERLTGRHCAKGAPRNWYRTIDRIWRDLTWRPKLLIPDIKGEPTVLLDTGRYYPHHNLYYIESNTWNLAALATVLRSSVAVFFVATYCVKMAGGFLRFQAQYLRRIRVPAWSSLTLTQQQALHDASATLDIDVIDRAVASAYNLSAEDAALVRAAADEARVLRKGARVDPDPAR